MQQTILATAMQLFSEHGFAGTSIQRIADAVGIRKPSLLYWYPSKDALIDAVLDEVLGGWKDSIPKLLLAASSGKERLDDALQEVGEYFLRYPNRARLLTRALLDHPAAMHQRLERHLSPWTPLVAEYIRTGIKEGRLHPDLDPEAWLVQIVTLCVGTFSVGSVVAGFGMATDPDSPARRQAELFRIARTSLFRYRPHPSEE